MSFIKDLQDLCAVHSVYLEGTMRIISDERVVERGGLESFSLEEKDTRMIGEHKDNYGPFLIGNLKYKPVEFKPQKAGKAAYVSSDYEAYDCPVTGKMIEGRAAHRENLKRTGCRILEKGEGRDAERTRKENVEITAAKSARQIAENIANNWAG